MNKNDFLKKWQGKSSLQAKKLFEADVESLFAEEKTKIDPILKSPPQEFFNSMESFEELSTVLRKTYPKGSFNLGMFKDVFGQAPKEQVTGFITQLLQFGFIKQSKERGHFELITNPVRRIEQCNFNTKQMEHTRSIMDMNIRVVEQVIKFKHSKGIRASA